MVWKIRYRTHMYVIHTIWRIWHVDGDEQRGTDVGGRKGLTNGCWMEANGCQTKLWRTVMLTKLWRTVIVMDDDYDSWWWQWTTIATIGDGNGWQLRRLLLATDNNCNRWWQRENNDDGDGDGDDDNVAKWFAFASFAAMACRRE